MKLSRMTVASATSVLLLAALAGCGGNSPATQSDGTSAAPAQGAPAQGAPAGMPGASGTIAAISGKTLQVQDDQTGQVAVTWTAKTTFTREADAALADVTVGKCVVVGADPATSGSNTGTVAATSVRIADAVNGACAGGPGFGGPGGGPGGRPGGMPTDRPSNLPGGGAGFPGGMRPGTVGQVTAVSASGFTVDAIQPGAASSTAATAPVTVTVAGATTFTKTVDAASADLSVGLCATATGSADNTGAVSATRIALSNPVAGACNSGMRGRMGGGLPAAGNQS
ncbi:MAG: hypothetical protein JWO11_3697 [Nocardioides sp.]|nr:hypothetical protein [Nocardioides sp.]